MLFAFILLSIFSLLDLSRILYNIIRLLENYTFK